MNVTGNAIFRNGINVTNGITGTLLTASQPNVTAVGVLTSLDVTGSMNVTGNSTFRNGINVTNGITGTLLTASQTNITAVGVLTALNVTGALAVTGTSRFVGNSTFANGINVTNGITGTLLTASQPNVTAVGILNSLTVTGQIQVTGFSSSIILNDQFSSISLPGNSSSITVGLYNIFQPFSYTSIVPGSIQLGTLTGYTGSFSSSMTVQNINVSTAARSWFL
jgi:hypothetical protein